MIQQRKSVRQEKLGKTSRRASPQTFLGSPRCPFGNIDGSHREAIRTKPKLVASIYTQPSSPEKNTRGKEDRHALGGICEAVLEQSPKQELPYNPRQCPFWCPFTPTSKGYRQAKARQYHLYDAVSNLLTPPTPPNISEARANA